MKLFLGLMIPFLGTAFGASMVFFMKNNIRSRLEKVLLGFAAGVMIAASIWSLLLPSIEMAREQGVIAWVPAAVGLILGIFGLLVIHLSFSNVSFNRCGDDDKFKKTIMMIIAVTLHNIPEGMAVGIVFAGALSKSALVTMAGAFALSVGIAIQNFPEGAIISMPLKGRGISKKKSFLYGLLSGIVEPISGFITVLLTNAISVILPYFLSFAAGAMIYVVVDELIPECQEGEHSYFGLMGVTFGFVLMMVLDVALG